MKAIPRRFVPSTLQGQITLVIVAAILAVVMAAQGVEPLIRSGYLEIADLDGVVFRAAMVAELLGPSNPDERAWLLEQTARVGFDVAVIDRATLHATVAGLDSEFTLSRWFFHLFPPDAYLEDDSGWDISDGRPFFWVQVDGQSVLIVRNLPPITATSDFVGPFAFFVIATGVLLVLFSVLAARSVARPVARISAELDRSDGISEETPIAERGTIEMVRLARAVNGMRARVRGLIDMRMRMLRSVSHDLRTPLTRLRLRAERVEGHTLRDALTADIDHIDALVGETLEYLRADAVGEEMEKVDVAILLQTIQAEFADVGYPVSYHGLERLSVLCRPNGLTRAVNNLCDNALKFGREAVISLAVEEDKYRIDVADDGPGIPAEKRSLVLEPFFKLDTSRGPGSRKGFGLGLSIVSDIVRAHGGIVEFHDRLPHGLVVRLRLPIDSRGRVP